MQKTWSQYKASEHLNGRTPTYGEYMKSLHRPQSESALEAYAKKQVKARGGLYLKFVSPGFTGVPDRICIKPGGEVFFVEHKAPGGKLSERQKVVGEQFREIGATYYVAASKEDIDEIVKLEFE